MNKYLIISSLFLSGCSSNNENNYNKLSFENIDICNSSYKHVYREEIMEDICKKD